jgi:hypothetical protein
VGDQVYATHTETGITEQKSVRQIFSRVTDKLVRICAGQDTLLTTPEHPFYVAGQWIEAGQLKEGDALTVLPFMQAVASSSKVAGSYRLVVENIARLDTLVTVYNFAVEDFHTYYVGKEAILVHNECRQRVSAGGNVARGADDVATFINKSLAQKLDDIDNIWKTKYPIQEMLEGRSFFEDIMGQYRYTKSSGWAHTSDIADNFKGVDFYMGTAQRNQIFAESAISMKTTITTNVDNWLASEPIKKNIEFLTDGLNPTKGLQSNSKLMFIQNAEIHIYMPKENITDALTSIWLNKLNTVNPKIKFEIKSLEDFVK